MKFISMECKELSSVNSEEKGDIRAQLQHIHNKTDNSRFIVAS